MAHIRIDVNRQTKSKSELKLAEALTAFSDDWDVWMNRKLNFVADKISINREVDSILYHRTEGMIIVECKDGEIYTHYDEEAKNNIWWQGDHTIDSPAVQASSLTPQLHDYLGKIIRNEFGAPCPIRIQWAVFFGSKTTMDNLPAAELPAERTILLPMLNNIAALENKFLDILHLKEASKGDKPFPNEELNNKQYNRLIGLFNGEDIFPYSALWDMQGNVRAYPTLIQQTIMESVCVNPRIKIQGAAGSGKTMLMIWEAERLAMQGKKVAIVCYNELLASSIADSFNTKASKKKSRNDDGKIEVHELAKWQERYIRRTSIKLVDSDKYEGGINAYYETYLPELFEKALDEISKEKEKLLFDAILIDEGQDMKSSWINGILKLLRNPETGIVRFYYDPIQTMYNKDSQNRRDWDNHAQIMCMPTLILRKGFRSTQKILDWVSDITGKQVDYYKETPLGESVEIKHCNGNTQGVLEETCGELIRKGINLSDILVISLHSKNSSCLKDLDNSMFKWSATFGKGLQKDLINIVSSHRIKGLDSQVVIIVDFEKPAIGSSYTNDMKNRIFVAGTRAKSKLIVLEK